VPRLAAPVAVLRNTSNEMLPMKSSLAVSEAPPTGARVCAHRSRAAIERALARFPANIRPRIIALVAGQPRLADVAVSFPGLLATLAAMQAGDPALDAACRSIAAGERLRRSARMLGLPLWLRRLPPEAFPGRPPVLPDSEPFSCRIANLVPERDPERLPAWLADISLAFSDGGEAFALWMARHGGGKAMLPRRRRWRRHRPAYHAGYLRAALALYAWHSQDAGGPASALMAKPWHPDIGLDEARKQAADWLERIELGLCVGDGIDDTWLAPGHRLGIDFVPLRSVEDVLAEAQAMENCLASYGGNLADDFSRLWSLRQGGERVATLEIWHDHETHSLSVCQLKAKGNCDVGGDVWQVVYTWLAEQASLSLPPERAIRRARDNARWRSLWKGYWRDRGLKTWLPLTMGWRTLPDLRQCL